MKFRAILFDMDGTLVPMDGKQFVKAYFGGLAADLAPFHITSETMVPAMWAGVKAMVGNDGSQTNEEVFWQTFTPMMGVDREAVKPTVDAYYTGNFHKVKACVGENPLAARAVELAHQKAETVVLATNPLFPMDAQVSRLSWVGLQPDRFDLITAYEDQRFCKPNPEYYRAICAALGVQPGECLMIGNDETEDMQSASALGMQGYLVTDNLIPAKSDYVWNGPRGSFAQLVEYLEAL